MFIPFLVVVSACDPVFFLRSFGSVMRDEYKVQKKSAMVNLLHKMWKLILETHWEASDKNVQAILE